MTDPNPYEAPLIVAEPANGEHERATRGKRPLGLAILSILHVLFGMLLALCFVLYVVFPAEFVLPNQITAIVVLGVIGTTTIVFIVSAVGLWQGTPWGWWLGSFTYAWSIVASISTIVLALTLRSGRGDFGTPAIYTLLSGLVINYLFRSNVRRYCAADSRSAAWALAAIFGIAIVMVAVVRLGTWLTLHRI
jgi:hypothetical protein